jgi:hypothetical protein
MTPDQFTRAASKLEAALHHLDITPGHTTEAQLAADDAAILPALVDGKPVITPAQECRMADGRETLNPATSPA